MHDFVNYVFSSFTCESCLLCNTYLNWNYLALITNNLIINISRTSLKWFSNVNGKLMVIVAIMVMAPVRQNWGFAKVLVTFANCVSSQKVCLLVVFDQRGKCESSLPISTLKLSFEGRLSSSAIMFLVQVLFLNLVQIWIWSEMEFDAPYSLHEIENRGCTPKYVKNWRNWLLK